MPLVHKIIRLLLALLLLSLKSVKNLNGDYILEIPSIDLVATFSDNTTLNEGLEIHEISKNQNIPLIISGHSGHGDNVYFNDLENLNINDLIIIYYQNVKYYYYVSEITYFEKYSKIIIPNNKQYLYLITCDKFDMQKQLIISSKLAKSEQK